LMRSWQSFTNMSDFLDKEEGAGMCSSKAPGQVWHAIDKSDYIDYTMRQNI
jgi:hypothetical protein